MPGAMRILAPFPLAAWILTLCPPTAPTSRGHPLPAPLKENPLLPRPSGSDTTPAMSGERPTLPALTPFSPEYSEDDYDYPFTAEPPMPTFPRSPPRRCDYNHCLHLQVPCEELRRASGCSCPGVTGSDVTPEPPRLQAVHVSETGASLHWCAPWSTVREYRWWYQPVGGNIVSGPTLNSTFRLAAVSGLLPDKEYLFCIVASNQAGSSPTDDGYQERGPCRLVRTPAHQMPYVYIAAGLAAALVLVVFSALLWHFCVRRTTPVHHSSLDNILEGELDPAGAANSSFRPEEQL